MFALLREQIEAVFKHDPAARSTLEILVCYPGVHAILLHRLAHRLHNARLKLIARFISNFSRWLTGIEIHPGAQIGKRFFIDHGMGVVIGETSVIGDDVLLYQGVTLGGTGHEQGKRHPTLGNHVAVGSGATILGNIRIGDGVKVGAGSVVVRPAPDQSTVVGVPGRIVAVKGSTIVHDEWEMLEHGALPDPVEQALNSLRERITHLERELETQNNKPEDTIRSMPGG
jgi:serine O-acetyltransferase